MDEEQEPEESESEARRIFDVGELLEGYSEAQKKVEELRVQTNQKFVEQLNDIIEQKEKEKNDLKTEIDNLKDRIDDGENEVNDFKRKLNELLSEL